MAKAAKPTKKKASPAKKKVQIKKTIKKVVKPTEAVKIDLTDTKKLTEAVDTKPFSFSESKFGQVAKMAASPITSPIAKIRKREKGLVSQEEIDKNLTEMEASYKDSSDSLADSAPKYKFKDSVKSRVFGIDKKSVSDRKQVLDSINKSEPNQKVISKAVPDESEETEVHKTRPLGIYRKIAYSFIILTLILLAVIFYFSFVKVTIILIPNHERISSNLTIDIFDQDKKSTVSDGEILGVVKQVEVEQSKTYPASGVEVISEEVTGTVTLINNYNKNQPLVATTRLLGPDNKLFRIKNTVNIPAGGQLDVEVYADDTDESMVIGPTTFTIPGLWAGLQDQIYGESKEAMMHSQQVKKSITQVDIDNGVEDLKKSLLEKAESEVSKNYKDYDQVIFDIDNNSISQEVDGKVGEEKEEFTILAKTMVIVVAFNDDKIYELSEQKLISTLPDDKELIDFSKDRINYSLDNYNVNQGSASLSVDFAGKMLIKEGSSIIEKEKLVGLNHQQINDYLKGLPEVAGYEVQFYPSFIKKAPNLVDRIEIIIRK